MHHSLFSQLRKTTSPQKKSLSFSFSFVFLSLILCLLSFFIYLVQNSSFEKVKVDALKMSLHSSFAQSTSFFAQNAPSFEASQVVVYHQTQIAKMFPKSEIEQDLINDEISIFIPITALFKETSTELQPSANVLFYQITSLLNNRFIKNKYTMDFILFEDIPKEQNYPIFEHLTTERLNIITDKMYSMNLPKNSFSVGIEKGNGAFSKLHFRKRRTL